MILQKTRTWNGNAHGPSAFTNRGMKRQPLLEKLPKLPGPAMKAVLYAALGLSALGLPAMMSCTAPHYRSDQSDVQETGKAPPRSASERALDSLFIEAAESGDTAKITSLLQKGADVNAASNDPWLGKQTALMLAAGAGKTDMARLLLEKGADVDAKDKDGLTALMKAATKGRTEAAVLLLEKGADRTAANYYGKTALMLAKENGNTETAELLQNYGK